MAKKDLIAIHRIALPRTAKGDTKYAEPGTQFQIDADQADRLISLGAAKEPEAPKKAAPAKKTATKKSDPAPEPEGDDVI